MNTWLNIIHLGEVSMASANGNPICAGRRAQQTCGWGISNYIYIRKECMVPSWPTGPQNKSKWEKNPTQKLGTIRQGLKKNCRRQDIVKPSKKSTPWIMLLVLFYQFLKAVIELERVQRKAINKDKEWFLYEEECRTLSWKVIVERRKLQKLKEIFHGVRGHMRINCSLTLTGWD